MADRIIFIRWGNPKVGREKQALQLFQRSIEYLMMQQREGLESFEPAIISAHGGDLNGFVIIRGDAEKLAELRRTETWLNNVVEGNYCLENYGILEGYIGNSLTDLMNRWSKLIG